jgi:hypothetical protein
MAVTMVTASVGSLDAEPRVGGGTPSVWRKFLDAVVEPQPHDAEHEIIEYLQRHRYDLPPEVWIELERRRLGP